MTATFRDGIVRDQGTIRDALRAIDRGSLEIAFVIDSGERLLGTLTDGDIRRALLDGATLDQPLGPHVQRRFTAVGEHASRGEVLDMMQARTIAQVPIIDSVGRIVGVHLLREMIGGEQRGTWAVVMAGGRGERLRPITDTVPKPMIKVAGRPILERVVLHLVGFGIRRIFLSVNYLAEMIEQHFGDGRAFGCRIEYLHEKRPLGTGGALALLPERSLEPLLVLNGDLLTQLNVRDMLDFHAEGRHTVSLGVTEYSHRVPFGVVDVDGDRVVAVEEKPTRVWHTNAGIYCLDPKVIDRVPRDTDFPLPQLIEDCLRRGESVGAFHIGGDWIDIGRPHELKRARGEPEVME